MVTEILEEGGIALSDCDALAFGAGPGSFTGLRVACSVAQGLGFGADLPVIGIGGLVAMAEQLRQCRPGDFADGTTVLSALDARMGEIYWSLLEWRGSEWVELRAPGLDFPRDLDTRLAESSAHSRETGQAGETTSHYGCGNAFQVYGADLSPHAACVGDVEVPDAEWIARLAARRIECEGQGAFGFRSSHPADTAAPLYVRERIALTSDERGRGERLSQQAYSS